MKLKINKCGCGDAEIWMRIPNLNGRYFVSSCGRVARKCKTTFRAMSIIPDEAGTMTVSMGANDIKHQIPRVHSLVAHAFLGRMKSTHRVWHIDGNKKNNHIENLRYRKISAINRDLNPKKGCWYIEKVNGWQAKTNRKGTSVHICVCDTFEEANLAYLHVAKTFKSDDESFFLAVQEAKGKYARSTRRGRPPGK